MNRLPLGRQLTRRPLIPLSVHVAPIQQAGTLPYKEERERENVRKRIITKKGGTASLQSVTNRGQWVLETRDWVSSLGTPYSGLALSLSHPVASRPWEHEQKQTEFLSVLSKNRKSQVASLLGPQHLGFRMSKGHGRQHVSQC